MRSGVALPFMGFICALASAGFGQTSFPEFRRSTGFGATSAYGASVAVAGDLNFDGVIDHVVGEPGLGRAEVISGMDGSVLLTLTGPPGIDFGVAVAADGDVDGDGTPDIVVGGPGNAANTAFGRVRVFSGFDGSMLLEVVAPTAGDRFGAAVAFTGDQSGDGRDDLLAGAPRASTGAALGGRVLVLASIGGAVVRSFDGTVVNGALGTAVARAGDLTGDAVEDFVLGAPGDLLGAGSVRLHSGASGALVRTMTGTAPLGRLGSSLDAGVDVTGDGQGDIIAGAPFATFQAFANAGQARVFNGITGAPVFTKWGASTDARFGTSVALVLSADGDSRGDFAVGSPGAYGGAGRVEVFKGTTGSRLRGFAGDPGAAFGTAVAAGGDLTGDFFDDIVVGAPGGPAGGVTGYAAVMVACGVVNYGSTFAGPTTLTANWLPGLFSNPKAGTLFVSGALPYAGGVVILSYGRSELIVYNAPVLLDLNLNYMVQVFGYDTFGGLTVPLDLASPGLASAISYLQFYALTTNPAAPIDASNGVAIAAAL